MDDEKRTEYDKKHTGEENSELDKKEHRAKLTNPSDAVIDTDSTKLIKVHGNSVASNNRGYNMYNSNSL